MRRIRKVSIDWVMWDREKDFGFHPKCDAKSSESSEMIYVLKDHPGESVENRIRQVQEVEQA